MTTCSICNPLPAAVIFIEATITEQVKIPNAIDEKSKKVEFQ